MSSIECSSRSRGSASQVELEVEDSGAKRLSGPRCLDESERKQPIGSGLGVLEGFERLRAGHRDEQLRLRTCRPRSLHVQTEASCVAGRLEISGEVLYGAFFRHEQ